MAADLHIYALEDCPRTIELLDLLERATARFEVGPDGEWVLIDAEEDLDWGQLWGEAFDDKDNVWIGEVSWLKAALMEDGKQLWIPGAVHQIDAMLTDAPVLTPLLATRSMVAMNQPNDSWYGRGVTYRRRDLTGDWEPWRVHRRPMYEGGYRSWAENSGKWNRLRERRVWLAKDGSYDIVAYRHVGMNSRRVVKRWLSRNMGKRVVAQSL